MTRSLLALSALAASAAAYSCDVDTITSFLPLNSTVFFADHYNASSNFTFPADLNYGALTSPHPTTSYILPKAACVIQANITLSGNTQHSTGLILPDEWNGRFMTVGNGEFAGSVGWSSIIDASWYGFAAISSDLGHEGNNGSFAYPNQTDALANFGWRALHDATVNGKAVTAGYYGQNATYSYYRGCSAGGKQGLKELEMFPEDFDGVIAGAPAWWFKRLQLYVVVNTLWNYDTTAPGYLDSARLEAVAAEVISQCDPQDGVVDGILQDPLRCLFRPETLLCGGSAGLDNSTCLNIDQIHTVNKLHDDWKTVNDTLVFPGWTLGTESGWSSNGPSDDFVTYIQYMLQIGGDWTVEDWNDDIIALSDRLNPGNATADDFDLSPFYERGGKLIHYHGLADPSIPATSSLYFYDQVQSTLNPQGINLDDFYRFFLVPGMQHCEMTSTDAPWYFSGDGQNGALSDSTVHGVPGFEDAQHDVVLAIMAWVENGTAPDSIIATRWNNDIPDDGVAIQRPLCPYPSHATYVGQGNTSLASSWNCTTYY